MSLHRAWIVTMVMNIAIYDSDFKWKRFEKIVDQHSPVLVWLRLCKLFQGMTVFNCNWIWKKKYFGIFSSFPIPSSSLITIICSASHLFNFQRSDQNISLSRTSRSGHGTRPHLQPTRSASDQTTTPDDQTSLRSDHRLDHASIPTPDHRQIRPPPPDQATRSDQPNRLPSLTAPLQTSTADSTSWNGTG